MIFFCPCCAALLSFPSLGKDRPLTTQASSNICTRAARYTLACQCRASFLLEKPPSDSQFCWHLTRSQPWKQNCSEVSEVSKVSEKLYGEGGQKGNTRTRLKTMKVRNNSYRGNGHIKAESPGTVVKRSLKKEFSGNFPREPQPKPLTISRWKALNLQKTPLLSTLLFRGTSSLPEKVSNAAC